MTPEQTLDWLAQQHFDQCHEERPIQDWIRKMKSQLPEQPKQNTVEAVKAVLKGIDKTEIESPDGWWETSTGAEFGAKKLKYVVGLLAQPEQEPVATLDDLEQEIYENTRQFVSRDVMEWMLKRYYTTPPQRTWIGLTDDEFQLIYDMGRTPAGMMEMVEAKLKEKNA